jgi:hypothetical protein
MEEVKNGFVCGDVFDGMYLVTVFIEKGTGRTTGWELKRVSNVFFGRAEIEE